MNLPTLNSTNGAYTINLDKNGKVLISITVNKNYFDRDMFEKGGTPYASCWKTLSDYKTVADEIYETICDYIRTLGRGFERDDFKNINFNDKIIKYNSAINCW